MSKAKVECNVMVHFRSYIGDNVYEGGRHAKNLQQLEDILVDLGEDGATVLYIEDIDMVPIVTKYIHVMEHYGYGFTNDKGEHYSYIGGRPYKFMEEPPSASEGKLLEERDLRLAVQSHIQSLSSDLKEEEILYIERRHETLPSRYAAKL